MLIGPTLFTTISLPFRHGSQISRQWACDWSDDSGCTGESHACRSALLRQEQLNQNP